MLKNNFKVKILLALLFVLALFLRTYRLDRYPVGLLWDEAALGYNAYSVLKTGKDEYGSFFPIIFKSFGDYKPGLYVYLTIPFVMVGGLNELTVRLPSAIFGALTILLIFYLSLEADKEKNVLMAFLVSFVLAINPWHLRFSRGAWELNIMVFELVLATYFFLKALNTTQKKYLVAAILSLILSLLTYQAAKFLVPALVGGLIFFFRKKILTDFKRETLLFLLAIGTAFIVFNLVTFFSGGAGRLRTMSLFSYPRSVEETQFILEQGDSVFDWTIFHSSPIFFARSILGRYFNYFSGKFLFIGGDWSNPRNGILYQGVMLLPEAIFLFLGLSVFLNGKRTPWQNFLFYWLLISPIPAALTRDSISSVRAFSMIIPLCFLTASGIFSLFKWADKRDDFLKWGTDIAVVGLYLIFFARMVDLYFLHDPKFNSEGYLYGYKEAMEYVKKVELSKNKVVISPKFGQPYIFYLFYTKYDPKEYQKIAKLIENPSGDVGEVRTLGKIEFRKIFWPDDRSVPNTVFVGDDFDLPTKDIVGYEDKFIQIKDINLLNNKIAFRIVETK